MLLRFLALCFFSAIQLSAGVDQNVELRPVHEALITKISGLTPIEVISKEPPALRPETPPPQPSPDMVWIEGYWSWNRDAQEFEWVCGIWRLQPEDHHWVSGYWNDDNGWWWVGGYWEKRGSSLLIVQQAPPSAPEENLNQPPNDNYFYAPGYWNWNGSNQSFQWLAGSWQLFDTNFVFVPATWQYRPEGYVFHPAFWDWNLDTRGVAYDCHGGASLVALDKEVILSRIYVWYPDYHLFFWFHWNCCHGFWNGCWCTPPWWNWWGWWSFNWHNTWWTWWWWGHPGFGPPPWIFPFLNQMMGPNAIALQFFGNIPMPFFITQNGVPLFEDWLNAIEEVTGNRSPLVPENLVDQVREHADQNLPQTDPSARPEGKSDAPNATRPDFGNTVKPNGIAPIPSRPVPPASAAPIPEKPQVRPQAPPQRQFQPPPQRQFQPPREPPSYQPPRTFPPRDRYRPEPRPERPSKPFFPMPQYERPERDNSDGPSYMPQTGPTEAKPDRTYPNQKYPQQNLRIRNLNLDQNMRLSPSQSLRTHQTERMKKDGNKSNQMQTPPQSEIDY